MKWLALALLLLNLLCAGWSRDALASLGWSVTPYREPERLQQQLRPDAMQAAQPDDNDESDNRSPTLL
jgi:hypothetical protein